MSDRSSQTNRNIPLVIASSAIVLAFGGFIYLVLHSVAFFTPSSTTPNEKVVAEALTLVGGLVAAIVSILGILLKYSTDSQAEERARIEADRLDASRSEAEKRLTLDSAIQAIKLFGSGDGQKTSEFQQAAALITLGSLDQHELALALASELLRKKHLKASAACILIDQALRRAFLKQDQKLQIPTVTFLLDHAQEIIAPDDFAIPQTIEYWDERLSPYAREWIPVALGRGMMGRQLSDWKKELVKTKAYDVVAALSLGWLHEPDEGIQKDIGAVLKCLLDAFPDSGTLSHPSEMIDTDKIREDLKSLKSHCEAHTILAGHLNDWVNAEKRGRPAA